MDQSISLTGHSDKQDQNNEQLRTVIPQIVQDIKDNNGRTLKYIKEESLKDYPNLRSKISEKLKTHDKLLFKQQQKEILFVYDEEADQKRSAEVQKISKKLLSDINTQGSVRNDKFIKTIPEHSKWIFNFTVKQLKKDRQIQTKKDGNVIEITRYLNNQDSQILQFLEEQLNNKDIQLVSQLKKDTVSKFPECQSKNLVRILSLLTKCENPTVRRQKIGQNEYIYRDCHQERFESLQQAFESDLNRLRDQLSNTTEDILVKDVVISEDGYNSVAQMLRQLNGDECAKLYTVKTEAKEKKIQRANEEKKKQVAQVDSLLYFLSQQKTKARDVLINKLTEVKKLTQFLKVVESLGLSEAPQQQAQTTSVKKTK